MKYGIAILSAALALAGCGSKSADSMTTQGAAKPGGPKTALNDKQFAEVKANCHLGNASLRTTGAKDNGRGADGSTSNVTITYDGPPVQRIIVLPAGVNQEDFSAAISCLHGEFDRLGAEAKLQLPAGMSL